MVYIVIPVFNRLHFTKDCIDSLQKQTWKDFKVIVVDDGSNDGTPDVLRKEYPDVIVLETAGDVWWTASTNVGIRHALEDPATTHVMTMNNDTYVPEDFMEKMMFWAEKKPDALLGAFDLDSKTKKPFYGGEVIDWKAGNSRFLLDSLPPEEHKGLHESSVYPGRGLLIPRKVFETIGLFDEKRLPHYFADHDFSHQAVLAGFPCYCNYDAKVYTYPEEGGDPKLKKTKTFKNYYNHLFGIKGGGNLKNFYIFAKKNCPPVWFPVYLTLGSIRRIAGYWK
jgi:GT2 family glycosyltransferase